MKKSQAVPIAVIAQQWLQNEKSLVEMISEQKLDISRRWLEILVKQHLGKEVFDERSKRIRYRNAGIGGAASSRRPEVRRKIARGVSDFIDKHPDFYYRSSKGQWMKKTNKRPKLYCDSQLEIAFCNEFETSSNVVSYKRAKRISTPTGYYIPDFEVLLSSGQRMIIEAKPKWRILNEAVQMKAKIAQEWCSKKGFRYFLSDIDTLRGGLENP